MSCFEDLINNYLSLITACSYSYSVSLTAQNRLILCAWMVIVNKKDCFATSAKWNPTQITSQ